MLSCCPLMTSKHGFIKDFEVHVVCYFSAGRQVPSTKVERGLSLISDVCKDVMYWVVVCVVTSYHNDSSISYIGS
jgi:hypothetical protein